MFPFASGLLILGSFLSLQFPSQTLVDFCVNKFHLLSFHICGAMMKWQQIWEVPSVGTLLLMSYAAMRKYE